MHPLAYICAVARLKRSRQNTKNYSIYDTTTNSKTPSEFLHSRRGRRSVASHTRDGSKHDSTRTPPRHTPQKWARLVPYSRRLLPRLHWRRQADRDTLDSRIPKSKFKPLNKFSPLNELFTQRPWPQYTLSSRVHTTHPSSQPPLPERSKR